jgi:hypothetical protein
MLSVLTAKHYIHADHGLLQTELFQTLSVSFKFKLGYLHQASSWYSQRGLTSGRRLVVKTIAESSSQHDENM